MRLPRRPGDPLLPYDVTGLTLAEIAAKYPRYVPRGLYAKVLGAQLTPPSLPLAILPPAAAGAGSGAGGGDTGGGGGVSSEAEEGEEGDREEELFFDALES